MNAPEMDPWNLALRFGLELAALVGLAMGAWAVSAGWLGWVAAVLVPLVAASVWGLFNVLDDPSRSGKAPVEVSGWIRLWLELLILGSGAGCRLWSSPGSGGVGWRGVGQSNVRRIGI